MPVLRVGSVSNNKVDGSNVAVTDNGNYIVDIHFTEPIKDVVGLATALKNTVGVLEHGLFVNMADIVIVAMKDGSIRVINRSKK